MAHVTRAQGGPDVVFIEDLTVCVKQVRLNRELKLEVVAEVVANMEIIIKCSTPAVTGGAVFKDTIRVGFFHLLMSWNVDQAAGFFICLLGDIAVALGAADSHFLPLTIIGVGFNIVVFTVIGHVAPCTLGVPVHAAAGPVAPVCFGALVAIEDIKPFLLMWVPGGIRGLPAATASGDEVLNQWLDSNGHADRMWLIVGGNREIFTFFGEVPFFYAVEFFAGERLAIKGEVEKSVGLAVMGVLPVVVDVLMTFLAALGDAVLAREFV